MTAPEPRTRVDSELDRLRWYVAHLGAALAGEGLTVDQIIHALKTGDASFQDLS